LIGEVIRAIRALRLANGAVAKVAEIVERTGRIAGVVKQRIAGVAEGTIQ
jgi:hypothetical protein